MAPSAPSILAHWESFYVIVGSSAAALTGLMFVVITLIADSKQPPTLEEINAFATPAVVHFSGVLLISAVMSAPWPDGRTVAYALSLSAIAGIGYMIIVLRRLRQPTNYQKQLEDWIWHVVLPFLAYIALLVAPLALRQDQHWALYAIGAVALLLLFVGIHNAWDTVTYIIVSQRKKS
jgi:bacteriorhodopsin